MRTCLAVLLFLLPTFLQGADDLTVLKPGPNDTPPRKMLYTYLLGQAQKHFDTRRQVVAALKTPEDIRRRQTMLRAEFLQAIGGLPERTPLNPRVVGKLSGDGFRVEKVLYESRPNHQVTAVLFLPQGKGPFPGVLLPCGHDQIGKANESYQRAMIFLARNGIAAMSYDPIGQGERYQLLDDTGKPTVGGNTVEHTLVGIGALLVGQNTATYRIWDGIRSLDYLASRPEIDPKRLGCTGCSGGGTLTSYLMALDDRIQAAAPSCYITSLEKNFATIGPQDAEQNITGQVAFGMEHADYLHMRVPKPTLLLTATRDFFNIQGSWATFREAKQVYGIAGHGERVDLFEYNTGHGYPKPQREAMVRFMRRWLLQKDDAPTEGDFPVFKHAELQCTRTGQVLEDFKGKSAFDLNVERERALAAERSRFIKKPRKEVVAHIRKLLGLPDEVKAATRKEVGQLKRGCCTIHKLVYETGPGITVPALLFGTPRKKRPLIVYVNGSGKAADAAEGGPIEKRVKDGYNVLALDLRGWGETAPSTDRTSKWMKYFGPDWKEAFLGLHVNQPLLGQRVYDLLAVLEAEMEETCRVHLVGIGAAGPVVLHAALFKRPNTEDSELTVEGSLASWARVVKSPVSHEQLANVVPSVLRYYDLPDLGALAAPWEVTVRDAIDPVGKPIAQAAPQPKPGLPKVVLIGDSIRMGYAPLVARRLEGKAVIVSAKANGGDSANVLRNLEEWVIREQPDVVHFNCGLHDLKLDKKTKKHQVEPEQYQTNLKQIVARLKKETNATLVFASTTPIHDERHAARKANFDRTEADVRRYNEAAQTVMREAGLVVHDLHWLVERDGIARMLGPDGTHYTAPANERLAEAVADCVLRQLIVRSAKPSTPAQPNAQAGEEYRRREKERDARVPDRYRTMPFGNFAVPANADAWKQQRPDVLKKVVQSLGDLPPRPSPQKVRRVSRELRNGYTLEKVAIDNGVDGEVTGLLLVPEKRPNPAPAILWLHSSTPDKTQIITPHGNGGVEPLGEVFVRAGYVVFSPDAYWHGDRAGTGPAGALETGRGEQESLHKLHLWLGRTLWGMFVRDDQVALDYLCSRPEVDKTRVGATGMSMGSTRAWWLAAVDDRIAATVAVACLTRYQNLINHGGLRQHGVYYFVNGLLKHFDTEGVVALIAPRPFLALTGELDAGSPADGIRTIEARAGTVYEVLSAKDRFRSVLYPDVGHTYTPRMRAEMLSWFDRWLKPGSVPR